VAVAADVGNDLTETAEIVMVEAMGVKPGRSQSVDVRLPVTVLTMATNKQGRPAPFMVLAAILDCDETFDETDKENNVLVVAREEIEAVAK
jgi:hypothetical protein